MNEEIQPSGEETTASQINVEDLKFYNLGFHGEGKKLFGIIIVNWLLTFLTLGLYYPWAKARVLQYVYASTSLEDDRFAFHGTGKEMFKGFIKAILFIILILGTYVFVAFFTGNTILTFLTLYLGLTAITPLAIHGAYRYRMSRTSWRGIRFGYRGLKKDLYKNYFKWIGLTVISLGLYSSWLRMNLRNFVMSNIKFGDIEFESRADGFDFFILNLKGMFLSYITFGIYFFWYQKELFEYYLENLYLNKGDKQIQLNSNAKAGDFFELLIVNFLILVFTLGLGYPWTVIRNMNFMTKHIILVGTIDLDEIKQTEENYTDAMGEDLSDFFDFDFVI